MFSIGPYCALNTEQDFFLVIWWTVFHPDLFYLFYFYFHSCKTKHVSRNKQIFLIAVLPHSDFSHGKFRLLSPGKASRDRVALPTYGACWVFECFHNPPNFDMDYRILNVRTDVNACDCTRGCTGTVRESALKADSRRKLLCRVGEFNQPQRHAGPMLYLLCYRQDYSK